MEIKPYIKSVRSEIINKIIFGDLFKSSVFLINKFVRRHVNIIGNKFRCEICNKTFNRYESIFRHIAIVHRNIVDMYLETINNELEYGEIR
ncbi:MAG: C2H2-type zinc finger protein [Ignisphaera sp.]